MFTRLLEKIEEQRKAYGGKVFDVLGEAFTETPLRDLLIDAIRYGELPETSRPRCTRSSTPASATGSRSCSTSARSPPSTSRGRPRSSCARAMDEARARRLQPHYIELAFRPPSPASAAGSPGASRAATRSPTCPRSPRTASTGPIATRYDRVTFDLDHVQLDDTAPAPTCSPPATRCTTLSWTRPSASSAATLDRGTVLVSPSSRSRTCSSVSSRRSPTPPAQPSPGASATPTSTASAPSRPPGRRRTSTASPHPTRRRRPRPAQAAVARRRRGQGDELDHRQPAAGVPRRGPAAARGRAGEGPRACRPSASKASETGSSSTRRSPPRRSRPARSRRSRPRA